MSDDDLLLMEVTKEPDLIYMQKRYLTLGYNPLDDRLAQGYPSQKGIDFCTNDYEEWQKQERAYRQQLRDGTPLGSLRGHPEPLNTQARREPATTLYNTQHGGHFLGNTRNRLISIQNLLPAMGLGAVPRAGGTYTGGPGSSVDAGGTPYIPGDGSGGGSSGGSGSTAWPEWTYKWVPYAVPSAPLLKGTTDALAKLKNTPAFFTSTLKYLQGTIRTPDWNPPVAKFAFPDPTAIAVPDSSMASLDVGAMVTQLNSLIALISQTELAKVITHYSQFDKDITYISDNLPDWGKYALDTNVERLVRIGRKLPDTLRDALRWMDSSHNLLVNTTTAVKMFESSVVSTFQVLPGKINAVFASVIANLRNATAAILAQLKTLGSKYTDQVKAYFTDLAKYIQTYVGTFIGVVKEWVSGLINTMITDAGVMRTWLVDVTTALGNGIMADITIVSEWVKSVFTGFSGNLTSNMTTLGGSMDAYTRGLVGAFRGEVGEVKDAVVGELTRVGTALRNEFGQDLAAARKEFDEMVFLLTAEVKAGYAELKDNLAAAKQEVVTLTKSVSDLVDIIDALKVRTDETTASLTKLDDKYGLKVAELEAAISQLQKGAAPPVQSSFFSRLFGFVG